MSGIRIDDQATRALVAAMDGLSLRQRVISNNLANVDTPGFKASDVSFEQQLARSLNPEPGLAMQTTHAGHLSTPAASPAGAQVTTRQSTSQRLDGNNVDLEREMVYLTETVLHFQAVSRVISRRLATLRTVINEGRK